MIVDDAHSAGGVAWLLLYVRVLFRSIIMLYFKYRDGPDRSRSPHACTHAWITPLHVSYTVHRTPYTTDGSSINSRRDTLRVYIKALLLVLTVINLHIYLCTTGFFFYWTTTTWGVPTMVDSMNQQACNIVCSPFDGREPFMSEPRSYYTIEVLSLIFSSRTAIIAPYNIHTYPDICQKYWRIAKYIYNLYQ